MEAKKSHRGLTRVHGRAGAHAIVVAKRFGQQQERDLGCTGVNIVVDDDRSTTHVAGEGGTCIQNTLVDARWRSIRVVGAQGQEGS